MEDGSRIFGGEVVVGGILEKFVSQSKKFLEKVRFPCYDGTTLLCGGVSA